MISVIMSVYNETEEYLRLSVESILNQTYKDFEYIIVLDNPDRVDLARILEEYGKNDKRIKLLYNEKNLGLTKSLNRALQASSGEYIARMDADDIAERDRLEKQLIFLEEGNYGLVGCSMRRISENGEIVVQKSNNAYSAKKIEKLLKYDDCIAHPTWFVKRTVYEELNYYRDIMSCEDYDFLLRARSHGVKMGIYDGILMNYRINTSGISRTNSYRQLLNTIYLQKNISRINEVTEMELWSYVDRNMDENRALRYEEAVTKMNLILESVKRGNKLSILRLIPLVFISKMIFDNYYKIFVMKIIKVSKD